MKVRAAVPREIGRARSNSETRPLAVEAFEFDPPGDGEVLVRIRAADLCHSDLSVIDGDWPSFVSMTLGHEAAGEALETGSDVTDPDPGHRVVMVFVSSCGRCLPCMEDRPTLRAPGPAANGAAVLISGARRLHGTAGRAHHHLGASAFAGHAVCARQSLVKVDQDLPFVQAVLFGCVVWTGVGTALKTARLMPGSAVAVVSSGGVGLNTLLGAVVPGAERIVAVDLFESKPALAWQFDARHGFNGAESDRAAGVRVATGGGEAFALGVAGSLKAIDLAYPITRGGGTTATANRPHRDHCFKPQQVNLVAEERTATGSYIGSCVLIRDVPRYIRPLSAGAIVGGPADERPAGARRHKWRLRPPGRGRRRTPDRPHVARPRGGMQVKGGPADGAD